MLFNSYDRIIDFGTLRRQADQIWGIVLQMVPKLEVKHGTLINECFELLELVFKGKSCNEVYTSMFLALSQFVFDYFTLSEYLELMIKARPLLFCEGKFV